MKFEAQYPGRLAVAKAGNDVSISIVARKNGAVFAFFLFWLAGWTYGGALLAKTLFISVTEGGDTDILLFFSAFWLVAFFYVFTALCWMLWGKEQLVINPTSLRKRISIAGLGLTWRYNVERITNCRRNAEEPFHSGPNHLAEPFDGRGRVTISFGRKLVNFGKRISNDEADQIVARLKAVLPALGEATS